MRALRSPLWFEVTVLTLISVTRATKVRIGIIGGGIGGTSTCYFLQKLLDNVDVDVYEPNEIGGRLATTKIDDFFYETGGSIIHEDNQYVHEFMKAFNLTKKVEKKNNIPGKFGIYNGSKFLFKEAAYDWMTLAKLVYHYGPTNFYYFRKAVDDMLKDFRNVYTLQKKKQSFLTVESMLRALSPRFVSQLKSCAAEAMESVTSRHLLEELVAAANVVNYGQSLHSMPEFVTYVSCAGMSGKLFSVAGGNKKLCQRLIQSCSGNLIARKVAKIELRPETGTYIVHSAKVGLGERNESHSNEKSHGENSHDKITQKEYDYVVVATPLSLAGIDFIGIANDSIVQQTNVKYHTTVTTLVQGTISDQPDGINEILLTSPNASFFNSLSLLSSTSGENSGRVHKIFSQRPLEAREIRKLFTGEYTVKYSREWKAYPEYKCEKGFFEKSAQYDGKIDGGFSSRGRKSAMQLEDFVKAKTNEIEDFVRGQASEMQDLLRARAKERENLLRDFFKRRESSDSVWESVRSWEDAERERSKEWEEFVRGHLREWEIYVRRNVREWDELVKGKFGKKDETLFEWSLHNGHFRTSDVDEGHSNEGAAEYCTARSEQCPGKSNGDENNNERRYENHEFEKISHCGKNKYGKYNFAQCEDAAPQDREEHSFLLHKGLYYVNVIELAASAMEMSAIGAHNVALLIREQIV